MSTDLLLEHGLHADDPILLPEMEPEAGPTPPDPPRPRRGFFRSTLAGLLWVLRGVASGVEWCFGLASLVIGLSILAAIPIAQFLSLGYLLESSSRVARSGRIRDGFVGVRKAARAGGTVAAIYLWTLPLQLVRSFAISAAIIDPGGKADRGWRAALVVFSVLIFLHVLAGCLRGGRIRHFLWPLGNALWLLRQLRGGGLYARSRDRFWDHVAGFQFPRLFRLGWQCFLGTLIWLAPPCLLITLGGRFPLLGIVGAIWLAVIVPFLPFLQIHYALAGRFKAMFDRRVVRGQFLRAPWAFAFALLVLIAASIPLHLLKIEIIPREAAWLPSLVFVVFLAPARILTGWAYARALRHERARHWFFRLVGRGAIIPAALLYVLITFLAQYTSWNGSISLYEQHAFLVPVPFLNF